MIVSTFKKLWHSGTATRWLNLLISPLRMFLLTPLVLTHWEGPEIASFYLVASAVGFSTLLTNFLPKIVNPVLVFFYAGVESLSEVGVQKTERRDPNWKGFADAFATLRRFQFRVGGLLILLTSGMVAYGLTRQLGWEEFWGTYRWIPVIIGGQVLISVIAAGVGGCLSAVGQVAFTNRNSAFFSLLQILSAAVAITLGGGLAAVVMVQLGVLILNRFVLYLHLKKHVPQLGGGKYDPEIQSHLKSPLKRGFIGLLTSAGLLRLSPLLMAGVLGDGNMAVYALCLNVISAVSSASNAFVGSQLPRLGKFYALGRIEALRKLAIERMILSLLTFLLIGPGVFVVLSLMIHYTDANIPVPPFGFACGMLLLFAGVLAIGNLSGIYSITNRRPFYLHNLAACLVSLTSLFILSAANIASIWGPLLAVTVPNLVITGMLTIKKFSELTNRDPAHLIKDSIALTRGMFGALALQMQRQKKPSL